MISTQDVETLPGTPVLDSDGDKVGDVAQVYVSDEGAEPLFVTVKTGLFGTKETFVPLDAATLVQGALHVQYDKAVIKDAPRVEADEHLSDDEQSSLFDYYEQHAGQGGADSSAPLAGTRGGAADDALYTQDAGTRTTGAEDTDFGTDDRAFATQSASRPVDDGSVGAGAAVADDQRTGVNTGLNTGTDSGIDSGRTSAADGVTLSEERLNVGTRRVETGRARLRKHIVTEQRTVTVPVSHEEVRLEREPITDRDAAGVTDLGEDATEVVLTEERPVVETEVVPVERVRLATDTVTEQRDVTADVRREQIETDGIEGDGLDRGVTQRDDIRDDGAQGIDRR